MPMTVQQCFGLCALVLAVLLIQSESVETSGEEDITVVSYEAESEFPSGIRFKLEVHSKSVIEEISLRMKIGQQTSGVYEYFEIEPSDKVVTELFWSTNSSRRYIPPGTIITYGFEVKASEGPILEVGPFEVVLHDARFEWKEVESEGVNVAYHGPVESRAQDILDAIISTKQFMAPILGVEDEGPIRVTMYNNVAEMLVALPPGSSTIRRELITEGQAFNKIGTLLVLGGGRMSTGTASHEVTHILVHRAASSVTGNIPDWLHEGLAEFGNVSPSFSYDIALDFAVHSGRILPITSMPGKPGSPEDVIIYYGQASSLIEYMVFQLGPENMKILMAALKSGSNIDAAIEDVYGMTKSDLENNWRDYIGADRYEKREGVAVLPTAVPRPTVVVFSLTPQAGSRVVESSEGGRAGIQVKTVEPTNPSTATPEMEQLRIENPNVGLKEEPPTESVENGIGEAIDSRSCVRPGGGYENLDGIMFTAFFLIPLGFARSRKK